MSNLSERGQASGQKQRDAYRRLLWQCVEYQLLCLASFIDNSNHVISDIFVVENVTCV